MSIQFGTLNLDGERVDPKVLEQARTSIAPYAHDRIVLHVDQSFGLLCSEFHTTKQSNPQSHLYISSSGTICFWDGRLDNAAELVRTIEDGLDADSPEAEIIAACYRKWGLGGFAGVVGDWALALWDPLTRSLVLATDVLGTRHLYYRIQSNQVTWSTVLDPLVLREKGSLTLSAEYVAGCLSFLPAAHLTPYSEIRAVPPSSYVLFRNKRMETKRYWDFNPDKRIRYSTDSEYEEHFLNVFGEAVCRRLRSDAAVLAELSGGMDSSSIVCVADDLIATGKAITPRVETISYYSTSEPDWDEQPYFTKIEERRKRAGCHINLGCCGFFQFGFRSPAPAFVPDAGRYSEADREIRDYVRSAGHRVLLSGLGGDEVTGGVPTPIPELSDLLMTGNLPALARQLKAWALKQRKPWVHLLADTCRGFLASIIAGTLPSAKPAPWLRSSFVRRYRTALLGYPTRWKYWGTLPSFQQNLGTLEAMRRRLAWSALSPELPCEWRYPYLDRDLLEFLFAIPREQLIRPGQRRSLMRRALRNIVPEEILHRKRKAFVSRAPRLAIKNERDTLMGSNGEFISASLGFVDPALLLDALKRVLSGEDLPLLPIVRAVSVEFWLRHLADSKVCANLAGEYGSAGGFLSWDTPTTERR
jgi:asparagine synthase (glutamine-hydrolysing)